MYCIARICCIVLYGYTVLYYTDIFYSIARVYCIERTYCILLHGYTVLYCTDILDCIARIYCILLHGYTLLYCTDILDCIARIYCIVLHGYIVFYCTNILYCIARIYWPQCTKWRKRRGHVSRYLTSATGVKRIRVTFRNQRSIETNLSTQKKTVIDKTLTYASETWIVTERHRKHLNNYERKYYVYWTVHHCDSWRIRDQLDVTFY